MNESQKQILLRTAKQTVEAAVNRLPAPMVEKTNDTPVVSILSFIGFAPDL